MKSGVNIKNQNFFFFLRRKNQNLKQKVIIDSILIYIYIYIYYCFKAILFVKEKRDNESHVTDSDSAVQEYETEKKCEARQRKKSRRVEPA